MAKHQAQQQAQQDQAATAADVIAKIKADSKELQAIDKQMLDRILELEAAGAIPEAPSPDPIGDDLVAKNLNGFASLRPKIGVSANVELWAAYRTREKIRQRLKELENESLAPRATMLAELLITATPDWNAITDEIARTLILLTGLVAKRDAIARQLRRAGRLAGVPRELVTADCQLGLAPDGRWRAQVTKFLEACRDAKIISNKEYETWRTTVV